MLPCAMRSSSRRLRPMNAAERRLTAAECRADVEQLVRLLAESHPDPYLRGGGMIAFHRRVSDVLYGIPDEGLAADELLRLLRPLVAAIGDGHTRIAAPDDPLGPERVEPAGQARLWLDWEVVEEQLYISRV